MWQNFSSLTTLNLPNSQKIDHNEGQDEATTGSNPSTFTGIDPGNLCVNTICGPAITRNRSIPLAYPGRPIHYQWGDDGEPIGPNDPYVASRSELAMEPKYAMFVSQLNPTYLYVPLVNSTNKGPSAVRPSVINFAGDPAVNGNMFIVITSDNSYLTPYNLSMIDPCVCSGPMLYPAGEDAVTVMVSRTWQVLMQCNACLGTGIHPVVEEDCMLTR